MLIFLCWFIYLLVWFSMSLPSDLEELVADTISGTIVYFVEVGIVALVLWGLKIWMA